MDDVVASLQQSSSEITIFTSGTTGQPKKVVHTVDTLTRSVRLGDKYKGQVWAYAYNPTHMAGLQVFFQAFENQNTLINVFNKQRADVYELIGKYQITHVSATPTFYRLLLPFEHAYESVIRVTLGGEKSEQHLYDSIMKIFPTAKINNVYASTEEDRCSQPRAIASRYQRRFAISLQLLMTSCLSISHFLDVPTVSSSRVITITLVISSSG